MIQSEGFLKMGKGNRRLTLRQQHRCQTQVGLLKVRMRFQGQLEGLLRFLQLA